MNIEEVKRRHKTMLKTSIDGLTAGAVLARENNDTLMEEQIVAAAARIQKLLDDVE